MNGLSPKPCNVTVTLHRRHTSVTHPFNVRSTSVETQNNQGGYFSVLISRLISYLISEEPAPLQSLGCPCLDRGGAFSLIQTPLDRAPIAVRTSAKLTGVGVK